MNTEILSENIAQSGAQAVRELIEAGSLKKGDILLHGHTHVPACTKHEEYTYINPGSTSIPKENSRHGYVILENRKFTWKDFDGNIIKEYVF